MKLKSQTITNSTSARRLPKMRPPTHPGEMLFEEFVKPLELTQTELARRLGVSYPRLNEIIRMRRAVTPDTALRLSQALGMSADFWLGLQQDWNLWHTMNSLQAREIESLKPISGSIEKSHNTQLQGMYPNPSCHPAKKAKSVSYPNPHPKPEP